MSVTIAARSWKGTRMQRPAGVWGTQQQRLAVQLNAIHCAHNRRPRYLNVHKSYALLGWCPSSNCSSSSSSRGSSCTAAAQPAAVTTPAISSGSTRSSRAAVFQSPKYFQQAGALRHLGQFVRNTLPEATCAGIVSAPWLLSKYGQSMYDSLAEASHSYTVAEFDAECSRSNLAHVMQQFTHSSGSSSVDYIVAFGGGKTLDLGKLAAHQMGLPVVVVPSLASSDAPCTALSVVYTDAGEFEEYVFFDSSPTMVVVDTQVMAEAPPHTLVAGMGDAMATYYEARAVAGNPDASSLVKPLTYRPTRVVQHIAKACLDALFEWGPQAQADCTAKTVSEALEHVIEANILMSGVGAESGGLAIAHGFHNALTALPETHSLMHGQKVAFGTLVQLMAEGDREEAQRVAAFNKQVGLPVCMHDLGVTLDDEKLQLLVAGCLQEDSSCWNLHKHLTPEMMSNAIVQADVLGQSVHMQH